MKTIVKLASASLLLAVLLIAGQMFPGLFTGENTATSAAEDILLQVPEYAGEPYAEINENIPDFSSEIMTAESWESYSNLDLLGRCGAAISSQVKTQTS